VDRQHHDREADTLRPRQLDGRLPQLALKGRRKRSHVAQSITSVAIANHSHLMNSQQLTFAPVSGDRLGARIVK
jgi:hypothetical protein